MNTKVLLAALAGTVTSFLTGWVIYGMLLKGYFDSQVLEGARSVMRAEPTMWAIVLGCLAWALLLALIYSRWAGISTFKSGAIAGAWVTGLVAAGADLYSYASLDAWTLSSALVDIVVNVVQGAIVGGVIGWALGYGNRE